MGRSRASHDATPKSPGLQMYAIFASARPKQFSDRKNQNPCTVWVWQELRLRMERSGETSLWAAVTYLYTEAKNPPANKIRLRVRFQVGSLTHCHFHCSACAQHVSAQLAQIARPNPTTSRTPPSCHWPGPALPAPFPSALSRRSAQNCSLSRVLSHAWHRNTGWWW